MDYSLPLTENQCTTDINSQANYFFLCHLPMTEILDKTFQELHPYIDIPADGIWMFHHFKVFHRDNIGISFQTLHHLNLIDTFVHNSSQIPTHGFLVHAFHSQFIHLGTAVGNCDNLDCRVKFPCSFHSPGPVYFSKGALS